MFPPWHQLASSKQTNTNATSFPGKQQPTPHPHKFHITLQVAAQAAPTPALICTWLVVGMMCDAAQMKTRAACCQTERNARAVAGGSSAATRIRWEFRILAHSCRGIPKTLLIMFPPYSQNVTVLAFLPYINHLSASQRGVDLTRVCARARANVEIKAAAAAWLQSLKIFTRLLNLSCRRPLSLQTSFGPLFVLRGSICVFETRWFPHQVQTRMVESSALRAIRADGRSFGMLGAPRKHDVVSHR